jgi:hypothetical protein
VPTRTMAICTQQQRRFPSVPSASLRRSGRTSIGAPLKVFQLDAFDQDDDAVEARELRTALFFDGKQSSTLSPTHCLKWHEWRSGCTNEKRTAAYGSTLLPRVLNPQDRYSSGILRVGRQDFVVQFVAARQTHPAMHLAGGRTIVAVEFFTQAMEMVLPQAFRFIEQCVDGLAGSRCVVEPLDVLRDDPKVGHRLAGGNDPNHAFGIESSWSVPMLSAQARACSIDTNRPAVTSSRTF